MKKFSAPSIWNPNSALVRCSKEISEKLFLLILYLRHSHYREEFKSAVQKFASSNTAQMLVACLPSSWTQAANQHHNITKNRKLFYSQKEAFSPTLPEKNFPGSPVTDPPGKEFSWVPSHLYWKSPTPPEKNFSWVPGHRPPRKRIFLGPRSSISCGPWSPTP